MIELLLAADRLLADGMVEPAKHLFEQVAEADPRNAIAVMGLARVALAQGDIEAAAAAARRALDIDPENVAARRMLETGSVPEPTPEPVPVSVADPMPEAAPVSLPEPMPEAAPVSVPGVAPEAEPGSAPRGSWLRRLLRRLLG